MSEVDKAFKRIADITGVTKYYFGGIKYSDWYPPGVRVHFYPKIRETALYWTRVSADDPFTRVLHRCPYCQRYIAEKNMDVDHNIPWESYTKHINDLNPWDDISNLLMWKVFAGCNDPANLIALCKHCNRSKGDRAVTREWIDRMVAYGKNPLSPPLDM